MSTRLHAVFNVRFGNVDFITVIFIIHGRKSRFADSSQNSKSAKSIFGHFEVIFLTYKIFPGRRWFFPVSTFKEEYFGEKMSSLAGLKKVI